MLEEQLAQLLLQSKSASCRLVYSDAEVMVALASEAESLVFEILPQNNCWDFAQADVLACGNHGGAFLGGGGYRTRGVCRCARRR